jgi:hypothetical protein
MTILQWVEANMTRCDELAGKTSRTAGEQAELDRLDIELDALLPEPAPLSAEVKTILDELKNGL